MGRRPTGERSGAPYGTRNGASKLNPEKVREIRRRYGREPSGKLAAEFGINRRTVLGIVDRVTWGWLE